MSAGHITEITRADLTLSILDMQPDCEKRVDKMPVEDPVIFTGKLNALIGGAFRFHLRIRIA